MGELVKGVKITQEVGYDTVLEYSVVEVSTGVKKVVKNQSIQETLDEFWYQVDAIYTGDHEGDLVKVWEQILESEDDEDSPEEEVSTEDIIEDIKDSMTAFAQPKRKGELSGRRVRITRFNNRDVDFDATLKRASDSYYSIEDSEIERYNDTLVYVETDPDFGTNNVDYYEMVEYN